MKHNDNSQQAEKHMEEGLHKREKGVTLVLLTTWESLAFPFTEVV